MRSGSNGRRPRSGSRTDFPRPGSDITASSEASRQPVDGPLFDSRIQGGIFTDGLNGCLSALMMNPPVSIFAQNNG